ncbi:translation initiation factor IF-2-like isoform X1 [Coturnix japonica]|uniref:translation initiation factor IF-2-like isoform X1 n=1 Tax=Coturnix japonica TaxID=93934 RepID=UPI0013A5CC74|nr:translation initiation factor IF-2-like isoform X1 [Coturnix japonica]
MRPAAIRSGPWLKRTRPGRCAPTSTVRPSARTTQVLALKAGKGPEEETQPAASAQEGTEDADRISTSCSLAAEQAAEQEAEQEAEQAAEQAAEQEAEQASEQAADDGAKGAGTSQAMLDAKSSKERARSTRKGGSFLPCCLSSSTSSAVLTDQQEEKKDIAERDTVAVAGKEPVSTSLPGAESLPPASPVPGNLQRKVDSLEIGDTVSHSSISGEGREPLPTCGTSLDVPAHLLKPAHATHKYYNLTSIRRPVATRKTSRSMAARTQQH